MKMPWVKLWRGVLQDEKISFLIARYGHEVCTLWIALLTNCEDGTLELDEDILASLCHIEDKRYLELREVFLARGLVVETEGKLEIPNWEEYQVGESTERVRRYRERQRSPAPTTPPPAPSSDPSLDETLPKREGNAEGTGEVEEDIEGEGDARAREDDQSKGGADSGASLVEYWYRRFAEVTKIDVRNLGRGLVQRDTQRARELIGAMGPATSPEVSRVVDWYFARWRSLWFAVSPDTRKLPDADKRPDFAFASFCAHYLEVAAAMSEAPPGPAGGLAPAWSTSRVNPQDIVLTDQERAEVEAKLSELVSSTPWRRRHAAASAGGGP